MRIISDLGNKLVWVAILALAGIFGYLYLVKNVLNPPATSVPVAQQVPADPTPTTTTTAPAPAATTATPIAAATTAPTATSTPTPAVATTATTTADPTTAKTVQPAIALPDQVATHVPRKLAPGAVLSLYDNVDNNYQPDPVRSSPTIKKVVSGLSPIAIKGSEFEQVSGYFNVEKGGTYSFLVVMPNDISYLGNSPNNLRLQIDGQTTTSNKGGTVELEAGWHKADLFLYGGGSPVSQMASSIQTKWAKAGNDLQPLKVWREVE